VLQSVEGDGFVTGIPAIAHNEWRKASVIFRQLPSLKKRVDELQQRIAELEKELAQCRDPNDG
jgi:UDP-3-O-[3-hydroxymyristoyl] glucosamine N-acyltransferase